MLSGEAYEGEGEGKVNVIQETAQRGKERGVEEAKQPSS